MSELIQPIDNKSPLAKFFNKIISKIQTLRIISLPRTFEDVKGNEASFKMMTYYQTVMVEAIDKILAGEPTISQEGLTGTYHGRLTEEECQINLNGTSQQAYNLVRGISLPYHGAQVGNIIIWKAHLDEERKVVDTHLGLHMGTVDGNYIVFIDGILFIDKYQKI